MLRIAIQTKGRLNEQSIELLHELGIDVDAAKRKFLSKASNFPIEVLYLRDDDIPQVVANGTAALGIVGLNEVAERGCDVDVVTKLGFGGCRISLAIPKADEYQGVEYFQGKRIATSYPVILEKFLSEQGVKAEMEVITGSVEIAPAAGIADAIFDIVSSGGTLVTNGLKEVERVFESEAVLIANKNLSAEDKELLDELLFRIESERVSRGKKYLLMNIPTASLEEAVKILPAMRSPTVMPLAAEGWCSLHSVVDATDLWDKVRQLKAIGAEGILVLTLDKIIP
ncbi:MAG: ATP phosphoribosyltransferase [Alistipes sp.]|nr:ATP phosphoribosyltransferase [Alistipes sp.]MBO5331688.1 ATP phosphoribosyltransferase [Alistipes sp.]MBQ7787443.1 ATP phosphoribosyltransferase [Alistipes sp.]